MFAKLDASLLFSRYCFYLLFIYYILWVLSSCKRKKICLWRSRCIGGDVDSSKVGDSGGDQGGVVVGGINGNGDEVSVSGDGYAEVVRVMVKLVMVVTLVTEVVKSVVVIVLTLVMVGKLRIVVAMLDIPVLNWNGANKVS